MKVALGWAAALVVGVVAIVAFGVAGYKLHWWMAANNTDHQRKIDQRNYGTQLAYIQTIDRDIAELAQPGLPQGQASAINVQVCTYASLLTSTPDNIATYVAQNC